MKIHESLLGAHLLLHNLVTSRDICLLLCPILHHGELFGPLRLELTAAQRWRQQTTDGLLVINGFTVGSYVSSVVSNLKPYCI